jgi:DNA primase
VIDLVAAIEDVEFRAAALKLQEWFSVTPVAEPPAKTSRPHASGGGAEAARPAKENTVDGSKVETPAANKPLTFQLKLDSAHPYLAERGLNPETIAHFGLGVADRGTMKGRLAIPIHDVAGELVAYAGRWVGKDEDLPEGEGKYKLPANFHKSLEVYNLNRIPRWDAKRTEEVILVEGYFSVFWLHQQGWLNVVSSMGSTLSEEQRKRLVERFDRVRIFFDGDEAGETAAQKVALDLAKDLWVRVVSCPKGLQPDRLPAHELKKLLGGI